MACRSSPVLHPFLGAEEGRVGLAGWLVGVVITTTLLSVGWRAIRSWRHHLSGDRATKLELAWLALYAVGLAVVFGGPPRDAFVSMAPVTAGALVAVGVTSLGVTLWLTYGRRR